LTSCSQLYKFLEAHLLHQGGARRGGLLSVRILDSGSIFKRLVHLWASRTRVLDRLCEAPEFPLEPIKLCILNLVILEPYDLIVKKLQCQSRCFLDTLTSCCGLAFILTLAICWLFVVPGSQLVSLVLDGLFRCLEPLIA